MSGGEFLQCSHPTKSEHRPLPPSERLVGILHAIVGPATSFLLVADTEFPQGRAVGAQPVGDDHLGRTMPPPGSPDELQCRLLVTCLRHEALEDLAFMIYGSPQVVLFAIDLYEHLVQVPTPIARPHALDTPPSDLCCEQWAEPVLPEPDRLVANVDTSLVPQILDVSQRQRKTDVHHHRQADDFRRGLEVAKRARFAHAATVGGALSHLKPSSSDRAGKEALLHAAGALGRPAG